MRAFTYRDTRFACYGGYVTQAIVNNLAPLLFTVFQKQFGISLEEVGRLVLLNFATQLVVDLVVMRFADRIGYKNGLVISHLFCVLGLIALAVLPGLMPSAYWGLVVAIIIYSIGGGYLEVLVSPLVESLPGEEKAKAMSLLHSFYCWGQAAVVLFTTLLIWAVGPDLWYLLPFLWAILPLLNTLYCSRVPVIEPREQYKEKAPMTIKGLLKNKLIIIALVMMLCTGAAEQGMAQWASLFAEKGLQVSKLMGDLLGPFLFAVFMAVTRTLYGLYGHKINLKNALLACGVLCVLCYTAAAFSPWPLLSLAGCAFCGIGVSLMWPGTLSVTAGEVRTGGTAMFGILAVAGDLGCSVGPWITGEISDWSQGVPSVIQWSQSLGLGLEQAGLKIGLAVNMIFPILLTIGVLLFKRHHQKGLS